MNLKFEEEIQKLLQSNQFNVVYDDELESLRGTKLAIDASILLKMAS
jgi:hypothetical protein